METYSVTLPEYSRLHLQSCPPDFRYYYRDREEVKNVASTIAGKYLDAENLNNKLPDSAVYPDIYRAILSATADANIVSDNMKALDEAELHSYLNHYDLRVQILIKTLMRLGGCTPRA